METKDLKVIITLKGERVGVGIQQPGADPVLSTLEGGLEAALGHIPALLEAAQMKWAGAAQYPKTERGAPPPQPAPRPATSPRPAQKAKGHATKTEAGAMKSMF